MVFWEDPGNIEGGPDYIQEYGRIWRDTDKVVFSRTLDAVSSERTRIEREFDPELIASWKSDSDVDMSVGGAELAGVALRAGLVDDVHILIAPVIVGGGKRAAGRHHPKAGTCRCARVPERVRAPPLPTGEVATHELASRAGE